VGLKAQSTKLRSGGSNSDGDDGDDGDDVQGGGGVVSLHITCLALIEYHIRRNKNSRGHVVLRKSTRRFVFMCFKLAVKALGKDTWAATVGSENPLITSHKMRMLSRSGG